MNDDLGPSDDISQLWGADDDGAWEPAPLRRPEVAHNGNGIRRANGQTDRLEALERDVRALVQVVERVESLVNERLGRLEQQVEELTVRDRPGHKGVSRLGGVIKSTRNH